MDFDAPTMDPSAQIALSLGRFVLRRVYDGGTRAVVVDPAAAADLTSDGAEVVVGRAAPGAGVISTAADPRCSRRHAVLHVDGDAVVVHDDSRHGTFVNGKREREARLTDGGVLRVGDTLFVLRKEPQHVDDAALPALVGHSIEARTLRSTLVQVGQSGALTLLLGETGTGKEVAARALHIASGRAGAFVAVNCGAIPEALAEAELFGREKGAYTGADAKDEGLVRAAHGGTLFLDEVGELPPSLQPKLLRFLDEGRVQGVGARKAVDVDARVVAATHKDLVKAVQAGAFRGDLYARLAEIVVPLPPLRQRRDDVLQLLQHALQAHGELPALHPDLAHALVLHPWPFNVREVMKVAAELAVRGRGKDVLSLELLGGRLEATAPIAAASDGDDDDAGKAPAPDREALVALLAEHKGVLAFVARATGRSRRQVLRWLEKHGLQADDYRA